MSDHEREHDGGRRRRPSGGSGVGRWLTLGGWALAAVLGGNLLIGQLRTGEGGRPEGFLSERIVLSAAFWIPLAALAVASCLGILWSMRVYARREKSSLLWTRNAFVFGLVSAAMLVVGVQDPHNFRREWLAAWCTLIAAAQVGLFAYASFREMRRTQGHGGRGSDGGDEGG